VRSLAALLAVLYYPLATVKLTKVVKSDARSDIVPFLQKLRYNMGTEVAGSASHLHAEDKQSTIRVRGQIAAYKDGLGRHFVWTPRQGLIGLLQDEVWMSESKWLL
jgi:hypothetical protein